MNSPSSARSEAYQSAIHFLFDRINYERTTDQPYNQNHFRLSRMERLLVELDNPQQAAPVIHIAGSKGKGSVAWLTAECLRHAGYRTGLYTSPHLLRLEERFVLDGQAIDDEQLVRAVEAVRPSALRIAGQGHGHATFFELTTAVAWWLFRDHATDVNVVEVGLGGRLDSTNVCWPALSVITSISFDHQQQLGNTLTEIAREKAGIIKPGVPVVSGVVAHDAASVIVDVARERGCKLRQLSRDFSAVSLGLEEGRGGEHRQYFSYLPSIDLWPLGTERHRLALRPIGRHQQANAAVVLAGLDVLREHGWDIDNEAIQRGLSETQVPARIEIVAEQPTTIIDTAHNEASIEALIQTLAEHFPDRGKRIIVFSASRDKKCAEMLQILMDCFQVIILTQYQSNPRAMTLEPLMSMANAARASNPNPQNIDIRSAGEPSAAFQLAKAMAGPDDLIVVAGSFFLAAEVLSTL